MNLAGRRALVTGSGVRIGRAIALGLARNGYDVCVHYNSSAGEASRTVDEIRSLGRQALAVRADLASSEGACYLAREAEFFLGGLDLLVHSASPWLPRGSVKAGKDMFATEIEDWDLSVNVNARAAFFLIKELASILEQSKDGCIITVLDTSVFEPFLGRAAHSIAKAALAAVTRFASRALAGKVRVNALVLGPILPPEGASEDEISYIEWGEVSEVVQAVLSIAGANEMHAGVVRVGC